MIFAGIMLMTMDRNPSDELAFCYEVHARRMRYLADQGIDITPTLDMKPMSNELEMFWRKNRKELLRCLNQ